MVCVSENSDDAGRFGQAINLEKPRMLEHTERLPKKFERYRGRPVKNLPQRGKIEFLDVTLGQHRQQHRRNEKRDRSPIALYRFERLRRNELAKHDRLEAGLQAEHAGTNSAMWNNGIASSMTSSDDHPFQSSTACKGKFA